VSVKTRDDIALGQQSHVGMARTENQDFFGFFEPEDDGRFDRMGRLAVVCDGMGGHAGGEIASRLAVKTIIETYERDGSGDVEAALRRAIAAANEAIYKAAQRDERLRGMGATCTAFVHRRDLAYFAQVGDSRGYLIRDGRIAQMTKDHSLVQQLVDEGLIDKSDMESHPDKNVILRSLGVKPEVEVDVSRLTVAAGDVFLVCTDGLSGPVSEEEMLRLVMASDGEMENACEKLVELANKYGGFDNITVQTLKVTRIAPGPSAPTASGPDPTPPAPGTARAGGPAEARDARGCGPAVLLVGVALALGVVAGREAQNGQRMPPVVLER
jgi:protein phosphatase